MVNNTSDEAFINETNLYNAIREGAREAIENALGHSTGYYDEARIDLLETIREGIKEGIESVLGNNDGFNREKNPLLRCIYEGAFNALFLDREDIMDAIELGTEKALSK